MILNARGRSEDQGEFVVYREIARFRLGGRARLGALYATGEAPCDRRFVRFRIPSVQAGRLRSGEQLLSRSALSLFSLG